MGARAPLAATAGSGRAAGRHRRGVVTPRTAVAGIQTGSNPGVVRRLRRKDGARADRVVRQGCDRQQHLAILRGARCRSNRPLPARSENKADAISLGSPSSWNHSWRSSSGDDGVRSASSTSPGSSGTTTRSVTRWAIDHRAGRGIAARTGAVRRPTRAGSRRASARRTCTRALAATSSASWSRTSVGLSRSARRRRTVPRMRWRLRLDASRIERLAVQPVRVDVGRRLPLDGTRRRPPVLSPGGWRPTSFSARTPHVPGQERPRRPHPLLRARLGNGASGRISATMIRARWRKPKASATLSGSPPRGGCSSMVRAPVCGTGGCGFESRHPPQTQNPL